MNDEQSDAVAAEAEQPGDAPEVQAEPELTGEALAADSDPPQAADAPAEPEEIASAALDLPTAETGPAPEAWASRPDVGPPSPPPPQTSSSPIVLVAREPAFTDRLEALALRVGAPVADLVSAGEKIQASRPGLSPESVLEMLEQLGPRALRPEPQAEPDPVTSVIVVHGTYHGPGCPDINARARDLDAGYDYDAHHPAQPGEVIVGLEPEQAQRLIATKSFRAAP